ncbi:STAS domain-containing protein [Actinomycetospora sp. OC33-EN08]|uniref:STAS domain-containing protein n=1 Tax=Actinomycetospora aurantiaca TaxID=3129233 RepID=A0ABU8MWG8_9PSEU
MASISFPVAPDGPTVVLEITGELDRSARGRLAVLLEALLQVPHPVVLDVSEARSDSSLSLAQLCSFRETRRAAGLACRIQGLHPAVVPGWDRVPLEQVFAVYTDSRPGPAAS